MVVCFYYRVLNSLGSNCCHSLTTVVLQALKPDYGSPHKMSRIDPTPVGSHFVNVEKLINSDNNQNDSKFNFVKFGADSGMTGLNQPNGSELHTYVYVPFFLSFYNRAVVVSLKKNLCLENADVI